MSERVNFKSSSILNLTGSYINASRTYQIIFNFLLPSSIKRLGTKGEQIAIHQLNNFNKAWMNTNLAKTPTLFTVKFQELLEIF